MKVEPRFVVGALLGLALLAMPLYIESYDPALKLERIRTPLCKGGLAVVATGPDGAAALHSPDSGLKMRATLDGAPVHVTLRIFRQAPGEDWKVLWDLDAPNGTEIYYLSSTPPGTKAYARAIDPTGGLCPADSPVLTAA